jgi:hypothetical protein
MVQITATRELRYAGKRVLPGDTFEASDKDAKILVAVKRATHGPTPAAAAPAHVLATRAAPIEREAAPEALPGPQTYSRRDMAAEAQSGPTGAARPSRSSPRARRQEAKS